MSASGSYSESLICCPTRIRQQFVSWDSEYRLFCLWMKNRHSPAFLHYFLLFQTQVGEKRKTRWHLENTRHRINLIAESHTRRSGGRPSYLLLWQTDGEAECRKSIPPLLSPAVIPATQYWDPMRFSFQKLFFFTHSKVKTAEHQATFWMTAAAITESAWQKVLQLYRPATADYRCRWVSDQQGQKYTVCHLATVNMFCFYVLYAKKCLFGQ